MKSYEEQRTEVEKVIKASPMLEDVECKEIIAEDDNRLLVRSVGAMKMNSHWYPTLNHELWNDKQKYYDGIASEFKGGAHLIYMLNIAGANEDQLVKEFNSPRVCNL